MSTALVFNADTTGATRYSQFAFNSLVNYLGAVYGVASDGIYELSGDTDAGVAIPALVQTGDLAFTNEREKNVPRAYIVAQQKDALLFSTVSTRQGVRTKHQYEILIRDADADDSFRKVVLGRGVRGTHWQFIVENVNGGDFSVSGMRVVVDTLGRKG